MAVPASIPFFHLDFAPPKFKAENTFILSGHGEQYVNMPRYVLGANENAMIPDGCGIQISTKSHEVFGPFFSNSRHLNIFSSKTRNNNISNKLGIKYRSVEQLPEGGNSPQKESNLFKLYYSSAKDPFRSSVPAMGINPLMTYTFVENNKNYIGIELSGILQKSKPFIFEGEPKNYESVGLRVLEYEENDLNELLSESPITNILKQSLAGSLLTYVNLIDFLGKPETEITVNEFIKILLPLPFIFNFISERVEGPFLLIVLTCRDFRLPAIPLTPSKLPEIIEERKKILADIPKLRRLSSVGESLPPAAHPAAQAPMGLSGLAAAAAAASQGGSGRIRRKSRRRHNTRRRSKKLKYVLTSR